MYVFNSINVLSRAPATIVCSITRAEDSCYGGIVREKIIGNEMSRSVNSRQSSLSQRFNKNR